MSIKISKTRQPDLKTYQGQTDVRRRKALKGGYENIVYATDQDLDGFHIRGLLSGFIKRYLPEFESRIGMLQTPIIAFRKKGKVTRWVYSISDSTPKAGEQADYKKGLGSWDASDLKEVVNKDGLENMIIKLDFDSDASDLAIEEWLGDDSAPRKKHIQSTEFSIASA